MNRVGELLERSGMSQKELAITMGIAQPSISAWVTQKAQPSRKNIRQLAEIFNVSREYVSGDSDDPTPEGAISLPSSALSDADIDAIAQRVQSRTVPAALDEQLVEMLMSLSPSQVQRVRDFLEGLKAAGKA